MEDLLRLPHYALPPRGIRANRNRRPQKINYYNGRIGSKHRLPKHDPTPDEIKAACRALQASWTPMERLRRRPGYEHRHTMPDEVVRQRLCRFACQGLRLAIARNKIEHTDENMWDSV